jgi:hypothetical protein
MENQSAIKKPGSHGQIVKDRYYLAENLLSLILPDLKGPLNQKRTGCGLGTRPSCPRVLSKCKLASTPNPGFLQGATAQSEKQG